MNIAKLTALAAMMLALASCSNVELDSAKRNDNSLKPLEFSMVVKNQTKGAYQEPEDPQIRSGNLNKLYMTTVGTFYSAAGAEVVNPTLELTKGEQGWSYIYNGLEANDVLYWPMEGLQNAQFRAWYYDGTTAATRGELDDKTGEKDAVGAYTTLNYVSGEQSVPLSMYHAVAKAEFKAKVLTKSADGPYKIKLAVYKACLHNVGYKASAYALPEAGSPMGAFTVADGKFDLQVSVKPGSEIYNAYIKQDDPAATIGSMFVMPQAIEAQDLSASSWTKPYISILAQIRVDDEDVDKSVPIFPKNAPSTNSTAWIALSLPSDFTGFEAHHKYIFTINLRDDAMGVADRDQNPNGDVDPSEIPEEEEHLYGPNTGDLVPTDDRGEEIIIEGRSAYAVTVSVEDVYDFDEDGEGQGDATEIEVGGGSSEASTTITWGSDFISTINLSDNGPATKDGITISGGGFADNLYYAFYGPANLTSVVGNISKIVINCSTCDYIDDPWVWNEGAGTLTWEGTPTSSIALPGTIAGISQIVFTVETTPGGLQSISFEGYTVWFAIGDTWAQALARPENDGCGLYDNEGNLYGTDYGYPRNVYCDENGDNYVPINEVINPAWTYRWGD